MYAACVKVYYLYAVPVKILFYMYACILHVLKCTILYILYAVPAQASEEGPGPLELELLTVTSRCVVQVNGPRFSVRKGSALNHLASSPAPRLYHSIVLPNH